MNNNIEDIYIGANYNSNNKNSKNIVLFFIIFLLIILLVLIAGYMYFFNTETVSTKQLFFTHFLNSNIQELTSEITYQELSDKILNTNYESNSTINLSTNIDNGELEGLDISKFTFELNTNSNKNTNKTYSELGVKYSGNEVLEVIKILTNQDAIGIAQDEIVNKYVGIHYNSLEELYGIDLDQEKIKRLFTTEMNSLTEDDKKELISNNIRKVVENIPEEKFTIQDNIAISQNDNNIPVTAYTLKLSQSELNTILVDFFKNIRNNEEILNKLIYKNEDKPNITIVPTNVTITPIIEEQPIDEGQPEEIPDENEQIPNEEDVVEPEVQFDSQQTTSFEPIPGEVNEFNQEQFIEGDEEQYYEDGEEEFNDEIQPEENVYTPELELTHTTDLAPIGEENNINLEILNEVDNYVDLIKLCLGLKINKTQIELEKELDTFIEKIDGMTGNGVEITVYASKEKTEKISITLPNENTIEIEVLRKTDSDNEIKITYLYKGNNSIFNIENDEIEDNFYTEDNEVKSVEQQVFEQQTNGISLKISKIKTPTSVSLDATINFIENEKINKKINIKSDVTGATTSNNISNNLILTISTKENESKFVAETNYKFSNKGKEIEDLTDDNCLFMETLSPEDYVLTKNAIDEKIDLVWEEKKDRFNFIDTNTKLIKRNNIDMVPNDI